MSMGVCFNQIVSAPSKHPPASRPSWTCRILHAIGGAYPHFPSKNQQLTPCAAARAVARAFDEMGSGMLKIAKSVPERQGLRAIIEHYLSARHANSPGMGCVLSALGPELARKPLSVRERIEASREAYRERLLPFVPARLRMVDLLCANP